MLDRFGRDAPQHDGERFGDHFRRLAERLGRLPALQLLVDVASAFDGRCPVRLRRSRSVDGPVGVVVPQDLVDLVEAKEQQVVVSAEQAVLGERGAEFSDLAPHDRHRPVLDVEVVVLDVREHDAGEAELAVEGFAVLVGGEQVAVLLDDPVAFGAGLLRSDG